MRALIGYSNFRYIYMYPLLFTSEQFAPEKVLMFARINELKSSFCAILSHCFSIIIPKQLFTSMLVASGGY